MVELQEKVKEYMNLIAPNLTIDDDLLEFNTNKVVKKVINITCNEDLEQLEETIIEMICGEILLSMKNTGQDIGIVIDKDVKRIKEGDTDVEFVNSESAEDKLNSLINKLLHEDFDYKPYSKMGW